MKKLKFKNSCSFFALLLILLVFSLTFSFNSSAAMSDSTVKNRLSSYTDGTVSVKDGEIYLTYKGTDADKEEIMAVMLNISQRLMGVPVEDCCRVNVIFKYTEKSFDKGFSDFSQKMCETQKILSSFWSDWSRYSNLSVTMDSQKGKNYSYTATFHFQTGGSKKDKYGESYDNKLLTLISEAAKSCKTPKEYAEYYLKWIDENSRYSYFYLGTNDPYHTLVSGKGVCGSFANAFKDLCNATGIPALLVFSDEKNHAWNEVYIGGKWYTADLCDIVKSKSGKTSGYLFSDPDTQKDNKAFIEKFKKYYVSSFSSKSLQLAKTLLPKAEVTCTASAKAINLKWKKINSAEGYIIKMYNEKSGKYETLTTTKGTFYKVKNLKSGTKYKFRVIPYNVYSGKTYTADYSTVTVWTKPGKTTDVKATQITSSSVKLSWKKVTSATEYEILQSTDKTEWVKIKTVSTNSYTVKNLQANTEYFFKVRALNSSGKGEASTLIKAETKLKKTTLSLSSKKGKVTVKWKGVDGAEGYAVYYSAEKDMSGAKKILIKNPDTLTKTFSSLKEKNRYYFRIRAYKTVKGEKVYGEYSKVKSVKVSG